MIVITRAELKFLRAGRRIMIDADPTRYRVGRTYALGVKHNKAICRVEILELGDDHIKVRIAQIDQPQFLAARSQYGYTTNPAQAMRNEGEPVPREDVRGITERDADRRDREKSKEHDRERVRSLAIRLKEAHRMGDVAEVDRIQREIGEIKRRMQNFAA